MFYFIFSSRIQVLSAHPQNFAKMIYALLIAMQTQDNLHALKQCVCMYGQFESFPLVLRFRVAYGINYLA